MRRGTRTTTSSRRRLAVLATATAAFLTALVPMAPFAHAATSGLDPSYGANGILSLTQPGGGFGAFETVVSQGVTYVAGELNDSNFNTSVRVYARDAASKPVAAFSGDGVFDRATPVGEYELVGSATAAPGGGLFVLVNRFVESSGAPLNDRVLKLLASGLVDTTFGGGDGVAEVPAGSPDFVAEIAADSTGRLYIAGDRESASTAIPTITRLTAAGAADTTFGGDGVIDSPVPFTDAYITDLVVGPDNLPYYLQSNVGTSSDEVVRLTAAGALDATFSGDGHATVGGSADALLVSRVAPNAGSVVVGLRAATTSEPARVLRLTGAGVPDNTFDTDGYASLPVDGECPALENAVTKSAEDALGRLIVLRTNCPLFAADPIRLSPTGVVDTGFSLVNGLDSQRYVLVRDVDILPDTGGILLSGNNSFATNTGPAYDVAKVLDDLGAAGARFTALAPVRILDTRTGLGRPGTAALGTTKIDLQVTGAAAVPSDATSVVLNVTAVSPSGGFITVWPAGERQPTASNINTVKGNNIPNMVIAKLGTGGKVSLKNSSGTTHLLADVGGYYSSSAGGQEFTPLQPTRLLDTRSNSGAPVGPGQTRDVVTTGENLKPGLSIPATASAVVVNVTAVRPTANGYVTVYPSGSNRPSTSSLNLKAGVTAPNLVTVKVGNDAVGGITLFNSGGSTHLLVDIAGYYSPSSTSSFVALSPQRLLDTRKGLGVNSETPITNTTPVLLDVRGGGVPIGATAVVLNVIAISPTVTSYITVYPGGTTKPVVSNLNNTAGVTRANLVIVKVGAGGINDGIVRLEISGGSTHMVADVAGYFVE